MKILMASHHFPPRYIGGVELITLRAAHWLADHGHQVQVVCIETIGEDGGGELKMQPDIYQGISVYRLHLDRKSQGDPFRIGYCNSVIGEWFECFLGEAKPDVLHVQSCYLLSASLIDAAQKAQVPTVLSLHDYWFLCPRITLLHPDNTRCDGPDPVACTWCLRTEHRRYRLLDRATGGVLGRVARRLLRNPGIAAGLGWQSQIASLSERLSYLNQRLIAVDMIITPAQLVRELVIKQGLDADHIQLVPYGLNLADAQPTTSYQGVEDQLRVGYLGNLTPAKGAHMLIAAFKRLSTHDRQLQLRIYGDADKLPNYTRRLRQLAGDDSRITFAGRYDNRDVLKILSELDVLVVPSLWYEIGPLVTLEAFASRTPVVAANIPNMKYQVTDGVDGLLYPADSVSDLARQLQSLVDDPRLLARLRNGIGPVRTSDQELSEWVAIYQAAQAKWR
jgi:glycosyltransferase involved in cell wall biosynthesis